MIDQYAVVGNPIAHSRSPEIHAAFARQVRHKLSYVAIEAPLGGFRVVAEEFHRNGGSGMNVTAPFKLDAFAFSTEFSFRAKVAGAANTLCFRQGADRPVIYADNTDGVGLVNDLRKNLGRELIGQRILLLGAGGAARGVVGALAEAGPACLVVANRTFATAATLVHKFTAEGGNGSMLAVEFDQLDQLRFDIVINATSASLSSARLAVPAACFAPNSLAYDMTYANDTAPFLQLARKAGANVADGIGMLVEQAAEAFFIWRGVRPETQPIIASLKAKV
jgi:shikimate dehydrogenase